MENKCENCIHKGICKLEERFNELLYDADKTREADDIDLNFTKEIKCKHFLNKAAALSYQESIRTINKITSTPSPYTSGTSTHPCEGCDVYEKVKKGGFSITDACYWCSKNPNKITCGDTPETISINNVGTCKEGK